MRAARLSLLAATVATLATVAACGGGGGSAGATPGPAPSPAPGPAPAPTAPGENAALPGEIVVRLLRSSDFAAVTADFGLTAIDRFGQRPIWQLRVPAGRDTQAVIDALRADPRVLNAEPNYENETPEGRRRTPWATGGDAGTYATQWAPEALRLPAAHALSRGNGIRVAVLDTGIDLTHPALAPRLARTAGGALLGRDFVDDDADPTEGGNTGDIGYGHGTHVAGLVALAAPGSTLMPARVLDAQGRGNVWVLAEALLWAVDPDANPTTDDGAHVVNLSLGTTRATDLLRTAVALADCDFDDDDDAFNDAGYDDDKERCSRKHGAVVLAAAGNAGDDQELQFPAAEQAPGALAVAASTAQRTLAGFSNRGSWVQIAAPGEAIISTFPGGGYATWSGTSMATPLAAGTAALVLGRFADPRSVLPLDVAKRLVDRSAALCGGTPLRQVDAAAAVEDTQAPDPACP